MGGGLIICASCNDSLIWTRLLSSSSDRFVSNRLIKYLRSILSILLSDNIFWFRLIRMHTDRLIFVSWTHTISYVNVFPPQAILLLKNKRICVLLYINELSNTQCWKELYYVHPIYNSMLLQNKKKWFTFAKKFREMKKRQIWLSPYFCWKTRFQIISYDITHRFIVVCIDQKMIPENMAVDHLDSDKSNNSKIVSHHENIKRLAKYVIIRL